MKILYIAKHDSGGNDDEGAIAHSLGLLGHEVVKVQERQARIADRNAKCDFVLFHKWYDLYHLSRFKAPKVFWYFDLVGTAGDESLEKRSTTRIAWMRAIMPLVKLGFCTDGDWVNQNPEKLVWLTQGFDSRQGIVKVDPRLQITDILFVGSKNGGTLRENFVEDLKARYGERFRHVTKAHGHSLAYEIAQSKIVVAPDSPITDNYWSNRVYLMTGFRGFLLHPWAQELTKQYVPGANVMFFIVGNREDLFNKIDEYLGDVEAREVVRDFAMETTLRDHTYFKRCERLCEIVQERVL